MGKVYVTIDGKKKTFETKEAADAYKASLPEIFKKIAKTENEGDKDIKPKTKKELEKEAKEKAEADAKALQDLADADDAADEANAKGMDQEVE